MNSQIEPVDHRVALAAGRRQRMRTRLIFAALKLAGSKAHASITIDDVLSAAEVSRGTFYRYFESPQELMHEIGLLVADELILVAESAVQGFTDPAERVACAMRTIIRFVGNHVTIAEFLVRLAWADIHESQLLLSFAKRDLEQGQLQQRFAAMPIELAMNIVTGTVFGAAQSLLLTTVGKTCPEQATASALRALGVPQQVVSLIIEIELENAEPKQGSLTAMLSEME
jgi:TetR/AcrR family transcriptional regulator, ethionamide resistance regulator